MSGSWAMENSKKLQKSNRKATLNVAHPLASELSHFLSQHLKPRQTILLALSGGLDSSVLLHLLVAIRHTTAFELHAMHVHHGLSAYADEWADFCSEQCRRLNVSLNIVRVSVDKSSKLGIEGEARRLRYQALTDYKIIDAQPNFIVTAHHQDDQAETLLLQLFRGAGVRGLSSMAAADEARRLLRPLLSVPRQALLDYAQQYKLSWCDDESNADTQFERNFVRHEVMPNLEKRYQSIASVLARTASHLAEANHLLEMLAAQDAQDAIADNSLCIVALRAMDLARAKNLVRWWFTQNKLTMPSAEHLAQMVDQLLHAKVDANINIKLQYLSLKRFQQRAYLYQEQPVEAFDIVWNGEPILMLPHGGRLLFKQVKGSGLALKQGMSKLRITLRDGAERFKPCALRPTRTLKYLFQEAGIAPWIRERTPLIYWHDTLAFVPNIGIAYELKATENEPGLEILWQDG